MRRTEWLPARHDLVWLDAERWRDALLAPLPHDQLALLAGWFNHDRPAVTCRQESVPAGSVRVGVAFAPLHGLLKIPLVINQAAVIRTSPPLALSVAAPSAPSNWLSWLERLINEARANKIEFSVYGSLAWQHLSGESYMTAASDVDLLWRARDRATLRGILRLLVLWQRVSGLRLDGELLLRDGGGVAWKEIAAAPRKLLVKRTAGVKLQPLREVLAMLRAAPR